MRARRTRKNQTSQPQTSASTSADAKNDHRQLGLLVLVPVVAVLVFLVHLSGCFGAFVFDDQALLDNEALLEFASFDWFRLAKRPVTTGTFAINFTLFGPNELSCHIVNVLIHTIAACFLLLVVFEAIKLVRPSIDERIAMIAAASAALIWGVHPLTTAGVTYIIQRAESLASLGMLGSVFCWSRAWSGFPEDRNSRRRVWAIGAVVAAYLAYGSKEMSAGLPLIVLLFDRVVIGRAWRSIAKSLVWYVLLVAPLVWGLVIFVPRLMNSGSGRNTIGFFIQGFDPLSYLLSQPRVFLQYLKLSVFPVGQSLDYGWLPGRNVAATWVGAIGWLTILAIGILLWKRARVLAFALTASLLILAPTSTLLPFQDIIFEHRFYLPLAILISCAVIGFASRFPSKVSNVGVGLTVILAAVLSLLTVQRNMDYITPQRIYEVDVTNHPDNPRAVYSLAAVSSFADPEDKIRLIRNAIDLSRQRGHFYPGTDYKWPRDLADTLFLTGQASRSREWYQLALKSSYDDLQRTEVLFQLAMVASIETRWEDAERLFQRALSGDSAIRDQVKAAYQAHLSRFERLQRASTSP